MPSECALSLLLGGGRMGMALLKGWVRSGCLPPSFGVVDPSLSFEASVFLQENGIPHFVKFPDHERVELVVLCIKPQVFSSLGKGFFARNFPRLAFSIMAGVSLETLQKVFGEQTSLVRAMPNTPAGIQKGMTGLFAPSSVSSSDKKHAEKLFSAVGDVLWLVEEKMIDALTAISGSGPAYLFYFTECLAKAAEDLGFSREEALRLSRTTVIGASALLEHSSSSPQHLREEVTSPHGTTAAALSLLQNSAFEALLKEAVRRAFLRAREMA